MEHVSAETADEGLFDPTKNAKKLAKATRALCQNRPEAQGDRIHLPHVW